MQNKKRSAVSIVFSILFCFPIITNLIFASFFFVISNSMSKSNIKEIAGVGLRYVISDVLLNDFRGNDEKTPDTDYESYESDETALDGVPVAAEDEISGFLSKIDLNDLSGDEGIARQIVSFLKESGTEVNEDEIVQAVKELELTDFLSEKIYEFAADVIDGNYDAEKLADSAIEYMKSHEEQIKILTGSELTEQIFADVRTAITENLSEKEIENFKNGISEDIKEFGLSTDELMRALNILFSPAVYCTFVGIALFNLGIIALFNIHHERDTLLYGGISSVVSGLCVMGLGSLTEIFAGVAEISANAKDIVHELLSIFAKSSAFFGVLCIVAGALMTGGFVLIVILKKRKNKKAEAFGAGEITTAEQITENE